MLQRIAVLEHKADDLFDDFLDRLSAVVEREAVRALGPAQLTLTSKVAMLLTDVATFTESGRTTLSPFTYAHYGYVVEELVNAAILRGELNADLPAPPPGGRFNIQVQGGRGMTRPDVIIELVTGAGRSDIAWFDISSNTKGNELHIWDKAGWKRMHYAGEAQYPTLDPLAFGLGSMTPSEHAKIATAARAYKRDQKARYAKINAQIKAIAAGTADIGNAAKRRAQLEESLGEFFEMPEKLSPATTKAILGWIGREVHDQDNVWIGAFGYGPGRDKSGLPFTLISSVDP